LSLKLGAWARRSAEDTLGVSEFDVTISPSVSTKVQQYSNYSNSMEIPTDIDRLTGRKAKNCRKKLNEGETQ